MGGVLINDKQGSGCTCGLCPWCSSGKVGAYVIKPSCIALSERVYSHTN